MARNLLRADPFAQASALTRDMFDGGFRTLQGRMPTTDVYTEDGAALVIEANRVPADLRLLTARSNRDERPAAGTNP